MDEKKSTLQDKMNSSGTGYFTDKSSMTREEADRKFDEQIKRSPEQNHIDKFDFTDKQELLNLINEADDIQDTIKLIKHFESLKINRTPFFLSEEDFEMILKWKLRSQYGRQKKHREKNTNDIIEKITKTAFEIQHENLDYQTELKLNILTSIRGIGIPVASAILTLCFPDKYGVIDFRIWNQLTGKPKYDFSIKDYLVYLKKIRELANKYSVKMQEIDLALWRKDMK